MSYKVFVVESFKKEAKRLQKKHASVKVDVLRLIESLEKTPIQGIPLGKDCYKIRIAINSKGKGKSGGARIVTCVKIVDTTIFH